MVLLAGIIPATWEAEAGHHLSPRDPRSDPIQDLDYSDLMGSGLSHTTYQDPASKKYFFNLKRLQIKQTFNLKTKKEKKSILNLKQPEERKY